MSKILLRRPQFSSPSMLLQLFPLNLKSPLYCVNISIPRWTLAIPWTYSAIFNGQQIEVNLQRTKYKNSRLSSFRELRIYFLQLNFRIRRLFVIRMDGKSTKGFIVFFFLLPQEILCPLCTHKFTYFYTFSIDILVNTFVEVFLHILKSLLLDAFFSHAKFLISNFK